MLNLLRSRIQELWLRNKRNRLLILVGAGALVILLVCSCLNVVGTFVGNAITSLALASPGAHTGPPAGTAPPNTNPTFPLPQPTVWGYPQPGATRVGSSGTPPPSPTVTPTPTGPPTGGGNVTYQISPDPAAFTSGKANMLLLTGPPGMVVGVSIFLQGNSACVQGVPPNVPPADPVTLDAKGQGTFICDIPRNLKNTLAGIQLNPVGQPPFIRFGVPVK